jgi:predicted MFS family arabinose efflux permease
MNIAALSLICFSGYVIGPPVVGFIAGLVGLRTALACLISFAIGVLLLAARVQPKLAVRPT